MARAVHYVRYVSEQVQSSKDETPDNIKDLGKNMKAKILFFINFLIVASLFSQAASADGSGWLVPAINEPIYLSICGAALLFLGTFKGRRQH